MKNSGSNHKLPREIKELIQAFPIEGKLHKAEDGGYWVESPQLSGCFATGDTPKQALHEFKYAIYEYFDVPKEYQLSKAMVIEAVESPEPESVNKPDTFNLVTNKEAAFA